MTADPSPEPADHDDESEGMADRVVERLERDRPFAGAAAWVGRSPLMGHWTAGIGTLVGDLDTEAADDKAMLDTFQRDAGEQAPAEADGVDLAAIKAADPGFDDRLFLGACRETLQLVRKARGVRDPRFAEGLLSPPLASELAAAVADDESSGRHHVEPELEIAACSITAARVDAGVPTAVVRFHLTGEELDRDTSMRMVAGSASALEWDEEWTFQRLAADGCDAVDEDHELRTQEQGGWMLAHRGWLVTAIQRDGAPDPLDPQNI